MSTGIEAKFNTFINQNIQYKNAEPQLVLQAMIEAGVITKEEAQQAQQTVFFKSSAGSEVGDGFSKNNDVETTFQTGNVNKYIAQNGDEVIEIKEGENLIFKTIKHTEENGKVVETVISYQEGKPVKKIKKVNGNTTETTSYTQDKDADDNDTITVVRSLPNGRKTEYTTKKVDNNGDFTEGDLLERTTTEPSGAQTTVSKQTSDGNVVVIQKGVEGLTVTKYDGTSISNYDKGLLNSVSQKQYSQSSIEIGESISDYQELQKVVEYMFHVTNNGVNSGLNYNKKEISNLFKSLTSPDSGFEKTSDNPPTYKNKDSGLVIYETTSQTLVYGSAMRTVGGGKSYAIRFSDSDNRYMKDYTFGTDGALQYTTIIDNQFPNKANRVYPNGEIEKISYENGKQKEVVRFDKDNKATSVKTFNWKNGRIQSTNTVYTSNFANEEYRNMMVIADEQGNMLYIKPNEKGEYDVKNAERQRVCDTIPILNDRNEVIGYHPVSEMFIDKTGRTRGNIFKRAELYKQLGAGEHYDFSKVDRSLRETAANQVIQMYSSVVDMLESKEDDKSWLDASTWINKLASTVGGGREGAIKYLKSQLERAQKLKDEFLDNETSFAYLYNNLTGNIFENDKDKYLKFNIDIQTTHENLKAAYEDYKKNGTITSNCRVIFNSITDGKYDEQTILEFMKEVDSLPEEKEGGKNYLNTTVAANKLSKLSSELLKNTKSSNEINSKIYYEESRDIMGQVFDLAGMVLEFGLIAKGLNYAWKFVKWGSKIAKTEKMAKAAGFVAEYLESEGTLAKGLKWTKDLATRSTVGGANFSVYDMLHEGGRQIYNDEELDWGKIGHRGVVGFATGASAAVLSTVISEPIMKHFAKPEQREVIEAVEKRLQKSKGKVSGEELARIIGEAQMQRGVGATAVGFGLEVLTFTGASGAIGLYDGEEIKHSLKKSNKDGALGLTDEEIENMSVEDMMRQMLKLQGIDTDNMSDTELYLSYGKNEYENQFIGLGKMKIAERVVGMFLTKGKPAGAKIGRRAKELNVEIDNGKYYVKGDRTNPLTIEQVTAMSTSAQAFDALDARLQNRFNKYKNQPMSGKEFTAMVNGSESAETKDNAAADRITIVPKDGKYEVTILDGNKKVVDLEGVLEIQARYQYTESLAVYLGVPQDQMESFTNKVMESRETADGVTSDKETETQTDFADGMMKNNPGEKVAAKIKREWQEKDLTTEAEYEDVDLFNLDPHAGLRTEAPEVYDEVTDLVLRNQLENHMSQRYDRAKTFMENVVNSHIDEIKSLAEKYPDDMGLFAQGIVHILAQETNMVDIEPQIVITSNLPSAGRARIEKGVISINPEMLSTANDIVQIIGHEFTHILQFRDFVAQQGEGGLMSLVSDNNSQDNVSQVENFIQNDYVQNVLAHTKVEAQDGSIDNYISRVYSSERQREGSSEIDSSGYTERLNELEAYYIGNNARDGLHKWNADISSTGTRARKRKELKQKLLGHNDPTAIVSDGQIDSHSTIHVQQLKEKLSNDVALSIDDLKEYFKTTGNETLTSLSERDLNSIIELVDKDNVGLLEVFADRNTTNSAEIDYLLKIAKNNPEMSENIATVLSAKRDGKDMFTNFLGVEDLAKTNPDKELLNRLLSEKKEDGSYKYDNYYISATLELCGKDKQKLYAINQILDLGKEIERYDLEDYINNITPENIDLIFWVDKTLGYGAKNLFEYCKSTQEQLPKLKEIYARTDINKFDKESLIKSYIRESELADKLFSDPRFLEDSSTTSAITDIYSDNKEVIDYLITIKNPSNPEYTKYEPSEIWEIAHNNLKKSDITEDFLKQIDDLKFLKYSDGQPICKNPVGFALFVKNNPQVKPLYDVLKQEISTKTEPCINDGKALDIMKNFDNIPKDYQERLLKLATDENNAFNLNHLWLVTRLATKDSFVTFNKKSSGDLFTINTWKKEVFDDIINRVKKGELTDMNELDSIGELVESINSPTAVDLYNKLMALNTPENKRFKFGNILELIEHNYFKMENLDFILNYKDVDGVTPRFSGNEINSNLIEFADFYKADFENLVQMKNSDGTYKFDGTAIQAILTKKSSLGKTDIINRVLSLETDGKAKFNGENCKKLLDLAESANENYQKFILDLMESPYMSAELLNGLFYDITQTVPSTETPWKALAKAGILTDSEGNIDEKIIGNIKFFWDGDTTQAENHLKYSENFYGQTAMEYLRNTFIKGGLNQVEWAKKVTEATEKNNLSQQESRFLWQLGKQSIYDNYHGRWSELNTDKIDATNKFLDSLLKSDSEIDINSFSTNEKITLLNYLNEAKIEDFTSNLPFSKFIRSFDSIDELRGNIIKELEKELKVPGSEIDLSKQQVGALLRGDFTNHLNDYPFIDNNSLLKYTYALDKAKNNDNIDSRDLAVLKFSTLLGGLSKGNQQCAIMARNLLEHNGLTSDITERVFNLIQNRNWFESLQQGKINIEDVAVLFREPNDFELAKIISEQDFSKGENKKLADNVETVLNKIYSTAPIVKPTKVPYEQSKFERVEFEGDEYKVVDFTNPNLDMQALGFPKGLNPEQVKILTHFIRTSQTDEINNHMSASSPELMNILCDEVNNTSLSTALVDPLHIDIDVMGRNCAVILEPMSSNYAAAYHEDFTSPLKKGYDEFKDYLTGKLSPEQRNFTSNVYKKRLNLSDSEYTQFYKALSKLDDTSRIKSDIILNKGTENERTISAKEVTDAIEYVNNSLSNITKNWDELIIYNPKIKALLYKIETPVQNNVLENCPKEILAFAKKHNLPIYIAKSSNYKDNRSTLLNEHTDGGRKNVGQAVPDNGSRAIGEGSSPEKIDSFLFRNAQKISKNLGLHTIS